MPRPSGQVTYNNTGRVILVTGGARGIGRSICEQWLTSGAHVACMDRDFTDVEELPAGILRIVGDTSSDEDCEHAVSRTIAEFGALDVLVNNAAIQPPDSYLPLHQYSVELWNRITSINLSGYAFMARHALRVMLQQQSGVICNICSAQGHRTAREVAAYGPIKAANLLQAKQWGVEYARQGIRVVSVSPGAIMTPMVRATLAAQGGEAALANRAPMGRIGAPEEIAAATLWICSKGASFVTATDLLVDGGIDALAAFAEPYSPPESE